jgi:hypothetical protein
LAALCSYASAYWASRLLKYAKRDGLSVEGQRWLEERTQPGNWIKIAPDEEFPGCLHGTPWVTLVHMFQIALTPEIERRISAGLIDDAFFVQAAQLIQKGDGGQEVRFNDEVRGVGRIRANQPVKKGDPVPFSDLAAIEGFDVEEVELDCGHFTMFFSNPGWRILLNLKTGRAVTLLGRKGPCWPSNRQYFQRLRVAI